MGGVPMEFMRGYHVDRATVVTMTGDNQ